MYNIEEYIKNFIISEQGMNFLLEVSNTPGGGDVDDGPRYYYGNTNSYKKQNEKLAKRIGMEVINYLVDDSLEIEVYDTNPPSGPPKSVTFYPAGEEGVKFAGTNYMRDIKSSEAFNKYVDWVKYIALVAGHSFVDFVDAELSKDRETVNINSKSKT